MFEKRGNNKGFTLIELVVVIAIIAILTMLAVVRYFSTLNNAKITTHNANVHTIISSVQLYQFETGDIENDINNLVPQYLDAVPEIPDGLSEYISDEEYSSGYVIVVEDDGIDVIPGSIIIEE